MDIKAGDTVVNTKSGKAYRVHTVEAGWVVFGGLRNGKLFGASRGCALPTFLQNYTTQEGN